MGCNASLLDIGQCLNKKSCDGADESNHSSGNNQQDNILDKCKPTQAGKIYSSTRGAKMAQLLVFYKQDKTVLEEPISSTEGSNPVDPLVGQTIGNKKITEYDGFCLKPKDLMAKIAKDPKNLELKMELFRRYQRCAAVYHSNSASGAMASSYLDLEITEDQKGLLNPTVKDMVRSNLLKESMGPNAKKRMAKRRLDVATGYVQSYARNVNGEANLERTQDYLDLAQALEAVQEDVIRQQEDTKRRRVEKEQAKADKVPKQKEELETKRETLLPALRKLLGEGEEAIKQSHKPVLIDLVKYFFRDDCAGRGQWKQDQWLERALLLVKTRQVDGARSGGNTSV